MDLLMKKVLGIGAFRKGALLKLKHPVAMLGAWSTIPNTTNSLGASMSVGYNGYLYYIRGLRVIQMTNITNDTTKSFGLSWTGDYPQFMYMFPSGIIYVVNVTIDGVKKVEVRKAATHIATPTVVAILDGGWTNRIACYAYCDGVKEYLFIGGYEQTLGIPRYMYFSANGGNSFTNVKTTSGANAGWNWHWHAAYYDDKANRFWIAEGDDLVNRGIWYSDDMCQTWTKINSNTYQPTLIFTLANNVFFGRDYGLPGLDKTNRLTPTAPLKDALTFRAADRQGVNYYPSGSIAKPNDNEAYIPFAAQLGASELSYIYGTGDGGNSFHKLYENIDSIGNILYVNGKILGLCGAWNNYAIIYTDRPTWI